MSCVRRAWCVARHSLRSYPAPPQVLQRTIPTPPHARHRPAGAGCTPKKSALGFFSSFAFACLAASTPVPSHTTQRTPPYPPQLAQARASRLVPTATAASSATAAVPATIASCVPTAVHVAFRLLRRAAVVHVHRFAHVSIVVIIACDAPSSTSSSRAGPCCIPLHQWAKRNNTFDQWEGRKKETDQWAIGWRACPGSGGCSCVWIGGDGAGGFVWVDRGRRVGRRGRRRHDGRDVRRWRYVYTCEER